MWILAFFLLHLVIYTLIRFGFMVWNWDSMQFESQADIFKAFWYGLRFDLSAIAATSFIFFMGLFWLERFRFAKMFWFGVFWLLNVALIVLNCADAELINFTARRFTKASFYLLGEGQNINVIGAYFGITAFALVLIALYSYATYALYKRIVIRLPVYQKAALTLLTLVVAVALFRGGLQSKPIMPVDGRIFSDPMANHMVLNSTFTLMKSLDKPTVVRTHHFETDELLGYLNRPDAYPVIAAPAPKANVVVLVLESFSKEYTELRDPEFTPYLNQLANQGVSFPYFYANSKSSISGIPSILAGVPALMDDPFIDSEFSLNKFTGIASVLAAEGYHTSFFHGANRNSMHFDAFAPSAGFRHHYSREDYPDAADYDGKWGIYDGPFLNWICAKYSTFPEPFMSSVFTLSSHQPYSVPPALRDAHPDGSHPILKSIHYTDASVRQFMECAAKQPWYRNTIFVFTADHAGPALRPGTPFAGQFEVPLVLYSPNRKVFSVIDTAQLAQQIDLLPTILETVGAKQDTVNHLARSLWHPGPKIVPLYLDGTFQLLGLPVSADEQLKADTRNAVLQYFGEGMLDDRLYLPSAR
jgi:hypothetical protein